MPEPHESTSSEAPAAPVASHVDLADQLRGFANETSALIAAIGRLASAEASLSLTALSRMIGLRLLGVVLGAFGIVFVATAGTLVLALWLGSTAAALAAIGLALSLAAAAALWRAKIWSDRVGFSQTRAALAVTPAPSAESKP